MSPQVVIIGSGFGGLNAARSLAGKPAEVLLIDRSNYHLFPPLLYQVATAYLEEHGQPLPQLAPVAIQQGQLAAENILRQILDIPPRQFRYRDKGTWPRLATTPPHAVVQ